MCERSWMLDEKECVTWFEECKVGEMSTLLSREAKQSFFQETPSFKKA